MSACATLTLGTSIVLDGLPGPEWHATALTVWIWGCIVMAFTMAGFFAARTQRRPGWLGAIIGAVLAGLGITLFYAMPAITSSLDENGGGDSVVLLVLASFAVAILFFLAVLVPVGWKVAKHFRLPGWFGSMMAVLGGGPGLLIVAVLGLWLESRRRHEEQKALERWHEETPDPTLRPYGYQPSAPPELR